MRRADVLGLMASQMMGGRRCDKGEEVAFFKSYIHAADALLREAERVSPEPEAVIRYADGSVFRVVGSASDGQA